MQPEESSNTIVTNLCKHCTDVLLLVLLSIIAPSFDVYSDTALVVFLASTPGALPYTLLLAVPQATNTLFTLGLWRRIEPLTTRSWSWVLVLLQCWPQVGLDDLPSPLLGWFYLTPFLLS